ncbi:MAG: glycosyltransferase [Lachnospiraceae bacterium]|nr:glycosyltransferase [Lachnospiraceae bacterium]
MEQEKQPLLTIGIIFNNEIRCLERCLEALAPLREAIPCELILADTGSDDGSREIAAKNADVLFDFPWVNDFAAARNAVMERASGQWYLSIDADEYLDGDISELEEFLRAAGRGTNIASLLVRNYETLEMNGDYADFLAVRLVKLVSGVHYENAVHEQLILPKGTEQNLGTLSNTILHHDGYAKTTKECGQAKQDRNRSLLKEKLAKEPENLSHLVHYIESSRGRTDYLDMVRQSVRLVRKKKEGWEYFGPAVLRNAVRAAYEGELEGELTEWISYAETQFPESFLTRIDVECYACAHSWNRGDYAGCIRQGVRYLAGLEEYRAGRGERDSLLSSVLFLASPAKERQTRLFLTEACLKSKKMEQAGSFLGDILFNCAGKPAGAKEMEALLWLERAVQEAVREFDWRSVDDSGAEETEGKGKTGKDAKARKADSAGKDARNPEAGRMGEEERPQKANGIKDEAEGSKAGIADEGMALARLFARVEESFLPAFYKAEVLCEENIVLLPAERRFGWYCIRAFAALDAGDLTGYVRQLKAGLDVCAERKDMVEYLTEETPELKRLAPSPELLELAKQVRAILSMYPTDSPAVAALKASPAYQQVAWLIEGGDPENGKG